jgi:hypothetical protein
MIFSSGCFSLNGLFPQSRRRLRRRRTTRRQRLSGIQRGASDNPQMVTSTFFARKAVVLNHLVQGNFLTPFPPFVISINGKNHKKYDS